MNLKDKFFSIGFIRKLNCARYIRITQLKFDFQDEFEMWKKHGKIARYEYILQLDEYDKRKSQEEYIYYCKAMFDRCVGENIEKNLKKDLIDLINRCCSRKYDEGFAALYERCIDEVKRLDATTLHIADWNILELLFLYYRAGRIAYEFRKKKSILLIDKRIDRKNPGYARWYALLENGMYAEAKKEMMYMRKMKARRISGQLEFAGYISDLITGNDTEYSKALFLKSIKSDEVTREFGEYVKDRQILIVGPAVEDKEGVDDAVIVRFNEMKPIDLLTASYPYETDISYYRGQYSQMMAEDNLKGNHLKYKVIREGKTWDSSMIPHARPMMTYDYLFPAGSANNVPNVIFDMLRFDIKGIKVTGSNLFITNNIHEKNYAPPLDQGERGYLTAIHNQVEQFIIMKLLADAGIYEPDTMLREVLSLSPEEYVAKLEKTPYFGLMD